MAKCTEVKPVPPPKEYVLTLTEEEAGTLRAILSASQSSIHCPPMYAVFKALQDAGVAMAVTKGRIVY